MTTPFEQEQRLGERKRLTSPVLQTITSLAVRVTLTGGLTIRAAYLFHKDGEAEQSFTSHPCSCSSEFCASVRLLSLWKSPACCSVQRLPWTPAQLRPPQSTAPEWEALGRGFGSSSAS